MSSPDLPSVEARQILRLLKENGNVLITGAPASGKTHLLQQVRKAFTWTSGPTYDPNSRVPLPAVDDEIAEWLPSPERENREVYETVFHQNTKYGEFLRAREARVGPVGSGTTFGVSEGKLYAASQHGLSEDGAALLIIDELNRGPAVSVFGPSLPALEYDKRLDAEGIFLPETTARFQLLNDSGEYKDYSFPKHLYLLAAMNQADTSIEALDVAFMRRWEPYRLSPNRELLAAYLHLTVIDGALPESPVSAEDVYRAAVLAWDAVNRRIRLGRGAEFELGHGVFMNGPVPDTTEEASEFVRAGWRRVRQHLDEVFFGSIDGLSAALNVDGTVDHPIKRKAEMFANDSVSFLEEPDTSDNTTLYRILRAVAG
jgi:5-methylcytosine-specific restriction protein B